MNLHSPRNANEAKSSTSGESQLPGLQFGLSISRQERHTLLEQLGRIIHRPYDIPPEHAYQDYMAGIEHAIQDLRILNIPFLRETDIYSHVSVDRLHMRLDSCNSRPLTKIGAALCRMCSQESGACLLDLGAGSGLVASQISRLVPNAELHTVGLTPINPYLRFRDQPVTFGTGRSNDPTFLGEVYEKCPLPFIAHQQITMFPMAIALPYSHYHLVHDLFGPVFHYQTFGSQWAQASQVAEALVELLHPSGTLYVAQFPPTILEPLKAALTRLDVDACVQQVVDGELNGIIAARSDAAIAPFLRQNESSPVNADRLIQAIEQVVVR